MSTKRIFLVGLILLPVAAGTLLFAPGRRAADRNAAAGRAQAVADAHARHLPPTKGSGLYQYSPPGGRRFDPRRGSDPAPPPRGGGGSPRAGSPPRRRRRRAGRPTASASTRW